MVGLFIVGEPELSTYGFGGNIKDDWTLLEMVTQFDGQKNDSKMLLDFISIYKSIVENISLQINYLS